MSDMSDETTVKAFQSIRQGMIKEEVVAIMGPPNSSEQGVVTANSGWGQQSAMWIEIAPGEPYLQLVYNVAERDLAIWFAMFQDQWHIALKVNVPKTLSLFTHRQ